MTQKKDLYDDIEVKDVELVEEENIDAPDTPESKKVEGDDVDPSIMAVLRRKEAEQKEKDAERNKWIKRGLMVAAGVIAIIALILSLRSCGGSGSGDDKPNKPEDPKHVHEYVEIVVPPTKTEGGYTLYKCEECGDSYQDNAVDALGKEEEDKDKTPETDSSTDNKPTTPSNDDKKPTTSTKPDNKPTDSKPTTTTPTNPSKPSDDKPSSGQDDKPSKPSEDTSSTTKPTEPEDTKPTTPSQPSEPTKPPVETKCPHETTQHNGCRWNVSGCSCSHKHVTNKVGSYTHIYCEDEVVSHRDGKTIWYPWKYYTENTSNEADTSSKVTSSKPVTSTAPETKPVESKPVESKPVESKPMENTTSTSTTTQPTTPSVEEETGCTHDHTGGCRYTQGYDCEHNHVEQKVGSYTYIYCEDETVAHRDGRTNYYPWKYYMP